MAEERREYGADRQDPSREALDASYEREDERWSRSNQVRDWLIIVAIAAVHFVWMLVVFLLEPGIR